MIRWLKSKLANTVSRCAVKLMMDPGDQIVGAASCRGSIYIITLYAIYRYEPEAWRGFPVIRKEMDIC